MTKDAGWFTTALQHIRSLADLPENWDTYGAPPPNQTAIDNAVAWVLSDACWAEVAPNIIPMGMGGIEIQWKIEGGSEVNFDFRNDGTTSVETL